MKYIVQTRINKNLLNLKYVRSTTIAHKDLILADDKTFNVEDKKKINKLQDI